MKKIIFALLLCLCLGHAFAAEPFIVSRSIMKEMASESNKNLVAYTSQYINSFNKRQNAFIKEYGSNMMAINKNLKRVQDDIYKEYNIKDEDGDYGSETIANIEEFNKSTRAVDLNKFINQKREKKKELIIKYFKSEVENYKIFLSNVDKVDVSVKIKQKFKDNLKNLTPVFVNDIPQNINQSLSNEKNIMNGQNPITLLKLQNQIDIGYVSMLDFINNKIDNQLSNSLLKSMVAEPQIKRDPIKTQ